MCLPRQPLSAASQQRLWGPCGPALLTFPALSRAGPAGTFKGLTVWVDTVGVKSRGPAQVLHAPGCSLAAPVQQALQWKRERRSCRPCTQTSQRGALLQLLMLYKVNLPTASKVGPATPYPLVCELTLA